MSRRVHVVVLCEGHRDYRLAYKCLMACGWERHQIAFKISPAGKQSAFTYVLDEYAKEVRANRNGKLKERALLVIVDADTQPNGGRERELAQRLASEKVKPVRVGERIAVWVPRRQLEAWVYFLTHDEADEETDYKREHKVKEREYGPAAERLATLLHERRALPLTAIPSLRKAVTEFDRLRAPSRKGPKRAA